jgi:hypothetical protein
VQVKPLVSETASFRLATLLLTCLCLLIACEHRPNVAIEGGEVPLFKLSGRGAITVISVDGPDFERSKEAEPGSRYMKPYWQIAPTEQFDVRTFESLGGLEYGKVPAGFRQIVPEGAKPAPALHENELLTFGLRTIDGGAIGVRFVIHNGKVAIEGS